MADDPLESGVDTPRSEQVNGEGAVVPRPPMDLWERLRKHKVAQWTLAYGAAAYTLLHIVEMISGALDWPHFIVRVVTLLLLLGLPVATTLAWFHGHRAQHRVSGTELVILAGLLALAGGVLWSLGRPHEQRHSVQEPAMVAPPARSVAVLPFVDMSEKKDQEYFSDGLSEELIDLLSKVPELRVPARTSSFYFKGKQATVADIAKALGVAHVLEGSVRKSGNQLRVTAQLVRVDNGYHLWSETYDRQLDDIFKIQDDIAGAVVKALKVSLLASRPGANAYRTANSEAYNQYLLGKSFFFRGTRTGYRLALDAYQKAVALDPGLAAGYAGIALAEFWVADETGDEAGKRRAVAAAEHAVALAPDLAVGYAARGVVRMYYLWDWNGASVDLDKATSLDPGDAYAQEMAGQSLSNQAQFVASAAAYRRAVALDPLSDNAWGSLGAALESIGELGEARRARDRSVEINPESYLARFGRGWFDLLSHEPQAALDQFKQVNHDVFRLTGTAIALHALGREAESQQALDELIRIGSQQGPYQIAEVYAWRGEKDQAFAWLERAYVQRDGGLTLLKSDMTWRPLNADPRYAAMLRKMKLPE